MIKPKIVIRILFGGEFTQVKINNPPSFENIM